MKISQELLKAAKHHDADPCASGICTAFAIVETSKSAQIFFEELLMPRSSSEMIKQKRIPSYWMVTYSDIDYVSWCNEQLRQHRVLALLLASEIARNEGV
jgi:hypothetical protein